ncbi:hypothetical protein [Aquipuribacter hungaricus]|uniref:Secreted protein n=2 Tax=Aquipuribacter hungaricus TaxID=545624 RepID=A0ABV7WE93_9MICO
MVAAVVGVALLVVGLAGCGAEDSTTKATDGLDCDGDTRVSSHLDYAAGEAPVAASPEDAAREAVSGNAFEAQDASPSSGNVRVFVERDGLAVRYVDVRQDSPGRWTADSITSCTD